MKKTTCALLAFGNVLCASITLAQTTLSFPKTVQILAVNGKEITRPRNSIQLPNGKTQLLVRLAVDIGKRFDSDMEYSQLVIMSFSSENEKLSLIAPKIKNTHDMRSFNKEMNLALIDAKNNSVSFTRDELAKSGIQFGRNYEQELAQYNQSNAPAALSTLALPPQQSKPAAKSFSSISSSNKDQLTVKTEKKKLQSRNEAAVTTTSQQPEVNKTMAKEMLYYWYEKADKKTRQEFLQAIKEQ